MSTWIIVDSEGVELERRRFPDSWQGPEQEVLDSKYQGRNILKLVQEPQGDLSDPDTKTWERYYEDDLQARTRTFKWREVNLPDKPRRDRQFRQRQFYRDFRNSSAWQRIAALANFDDRYHLNAILFHGIGAGGVTDIDDILAELQWVWVRIGQAAIPTPAECAALTVICQVHGMPFEFDETTRRIVIL